MGSLGRIALFCVFACLLINSVVTPCQGIPSVDTSPIESDNNLVGQLAEKHEIKRLCHLVLKSGKNKNVDLAGLRWHGGL